MTLSKQQMKNIITTIEHTWFIFIISLNIYIWHYSSFVTPQTPLEQKLLICFLLSSLAIVYILIAASFIAYFISLYFNYKTTIIDFYKKLYDYFTYSFKSYILHIKHNFAFHLNDLKNLDDNDLYEIEELDDDDYNYSIVSRKKRKNRINKLKKRKNKTI